jgi:hypothetical protein
MTVRKLEVSTQLARKRMGGTMGMTWTTDRQSVARVNRHPVPKLTVRFIFVVL